jgi:hypothetical protein
MGPKLNLLKNMYMELFCLAPQFVEKLPDVGTQEQFQLLQFDGALFLGEAWQGLEA